MKNLKLLSAVALAAVMASPAIAAEATGTAGATIVAPLQISDGDDLYFGTIAPSLTASDTVVVSAAGAKTCGAELTCLTDDHTAASFNVSGQDGYSYNITLPTTISLSDGNSNSMTVNAVTGSKASGTLSSGTDSFTVGGTLAVAANQAAGAYTGTFTVEVAYQ